jgi:PAS domain S-box-containing protein
MSLKKDGDPMMFDKANLSAFHAAIEMSLVPIVLTDPHRDDCPIIFANGAFCGLTGYDVDEIIGRNCRFMQGPATDQNAVARIRSAVATRWHVSEEIINYRKDGSTFWNALFVNPVFDQGGRLVYLFGTQRDVTRRRALEDVLQRLPDLLSVIQSSVGAALALPLGEVQRELLDTANRAVHEAILRQSSLVPSAAASSEKTDSANPVWSPTTDTC